jgi:hypothetical protein
MNLETLTMWTFGLLFFCAALFVTAFMLVMLLIAVATLREKFLIFHMERQRRKCLEKIQPNE